MKSKLILLILMLNVVITILASCNCVRFKHFDVTIYSADGKILRKYMDVTEVKRRDYDLQFIYNGSKYLYCNCWAELVEHPLEISSDDGS